MGPISELWGAGQVDTPNPGAVGGDAAQLMQQLINMQPAAFNTQKQYGPQYTGLTLDQILQAAGGDGGNGLSDIFAKILPGLSGSLNQANSDTRGAGVNDLTNLGGAAGAGVLGVNPDMAALLGGLTDSAKSGLAAGSTLTPQDTNRITGQVRGDWASRGLGTSAPGQLDEALNLFAGGQNVLQQRQQTAGNVAGLQSSLVTNPALSFLQTQSSAPVVGSSILGGAAGVAGPSGNTLTNPTDILSGAYNAKAAANIQSANNEAGLQSY